MLKPKLLFATLLLAFGMMLVASPIAQAQTRPMQEMPNDDADCVDFETVFVWDGPDAQSYILEVYSSDTFTDEYLVLKQIGLESDTYYADYDLLNPKKTYYWRVASIFSDGSTLFTQDSWNFTTKDAAPNLIGPENNEKCVDVEDVDFTWDDIEESYTYHLQVSEFDNFATTVIEETGLESNSFNNATLPKANNLYYWRVKSPDSDCPDNWSDVYVLKTQQTPPEGTYPQDGNHCVYQDVTFTWDVDVEADNYYLQVSEYDDFLVNVVETWDITSESYRAIMPKNNQKYYWRVSSSYEGDQCKTKWSPVYTYTTKADAPEPIAPEANTAGIPYFEEGLPFDVEFTWHDPEAGRYWLQISTNEDFSDTRQLLVEGTSDSYSSRTYSVRISELFEDLEPYNQTFWWRVSSSYEDCWSEWSEKRSISTPYRAPQLIFPGDETTCNPIVSELYWEQMVDVLGYHVQVSKSPDLSPGMDKVIDETGVRAGVSGNPYVCDNLEPETTYYWRVRAEDSKNTGLWSEIKSFTTTILPPDAQEPYDGETGVPTRTVLKWHPYGQASPTYDLQVSEDKEFTVPLLVDVEYLESNTYEVEFPEYNSTYWWRVKGRDDHCSSTWSKMYSVRTSVDAPKLLYPVEGQVKVSVFPTFQWRPVDAATYYDIDVAYDEDFNNIFQSRRGINTTTIKMHDKFDESTTFWWRARAKNDEGHGRWSEPWYFVTGFEEPGQPALVSPFDGETMIPQRATLLWTEGERALEYRLQITTDKLFEPASIVIDETTTSTSYEVGGLDNFTIYRWRVKSENLGGSSDWTDSFLFRSVAAPITDAPVLILPQNEESVNYSSKMFQWHDVVNAGYYYGGGYHLQISGDENFESDMHTDRVHIYDTRALVYNLGLPNGTKLYWRVRGWNEAHTGPWSNVWWFDIINSINEDEASPFATTVFPNPFSETAAIKFTLPEDKFVAVSIYDLNGKHIATLLQKYLNAGEHSVEFNAEGLESGVYFYSIQAGDINDSGRLVIVK